jgi:hypothetical protein
MRFLKKKIALARMISLKKVSSRKSADISEQDCEFQPRKNSPSQIYQLPKRRRRLPGYSFTPENVKETKNIVINYGKAISSFAITQIALPYLKPLADKEQVSVQSFQKYVEKKKEMIGGIRSLRNILIISERTPKEEASYKRIYCAIAEIFIKYFSVNWIIHGRMAHKDTYLKYRFKMLRRIQNPELFTYLKGHKKRERILND